MTGPADPQNGSQAIAVDSPVVDGELVDERAEAERRRAKIMDMRRRAFTFEAIGAEMGISRQRVHKIYTDTLKEIPAESVATYRQEQVERLDWLIAEARAVLERKHLTVQNGKVVTLKTGDDDDDPGEPLIDDGPVLEAARTILQIEKLRAELLGTPAPVRIEAAAVVRYEIVGVDMTKLQ